MRAEEDGNFAKNDVTQDTRETEEEHSSKHSGQDMAT